MDHFVFQDVCSEMPTVYIKSWSVVNPIDMATTVRFHDGMTSDLGCCLLTPPIDLYISVSDLSFRDEGIL